MLCRWASSQAGAGSGTDVIEWIAPPDIGAKGPLLSAGLLSSPRLALVNPAEELRVAQSRESKALLFLSIRFFITARLSLIPSPSAITIRVLS
jgi:hypothetical protein